MSPSRRDPSRRTQAERSATTVRKILDASADCLVRLGYTRTSTIEIAQAAGVSQGAVFRHFPTRLDLMVALAEDVAASILLRCSAALAEGEHFADPLRGLLDLLQEQCSDPRTFALYELIDGSRSDPELAHRVVEIWHELHARIVNAARKLPWSAETERSNVDAVVFVAMRVWEGEARFSAVVGDSSPVLDSTRKRITRILTAIFEQPLKIDWEADPLAASET